MINIICTLDFMQLFAKLLLNAESGKFHRCLRDFL